MTLQQLHEIKLWHVEHKAEHPLEYHAWDLVLTAFDRLKHANQRAS